MRIIFIALTIIFPFWLVFAYIYEWTPAGIRKTESEEAETQKSTQSYNEHRGRQISKITIAAMGLAIVLLVVDRVFDFSGMLIEEILISP